MFRTSVEWDLGAASMLLLLVCSSAFAGGDQRVRLILDTDANNELDDQHAIAYALFSRDAFELEAITVNNTRMGGGIEGQLAEARRVVSLCDADVPVVRGAAGNYLDIRPALGPGSYDGQPAVDLIVQRAHADDPRPLVVVAIGKLTNVALALARDPAIAPRLQVWWLGSNWPEPGEYNLVNDIEAVNAVLEAPVELHIAVVRYGQPTGTAAVFVAKSEIESRMPGRGPSVSPPVEGRGGGVFSTFGDYSVDLFRRAGDEYRALFDVAALALVKNRSWAQAQSLPAPRVVRGWLWGHGWREGTTPGRTVTIHQNFDRDAVVEDFFTTLDASTNAPE